MIASLPMYWRAENASLWRAFWSLVQEEARGLDLPDLTPPEAIPAPLSDHWLRPDLALSMTCGLPFRTVLRDRVTYVGTLDFGLDTPPGHYRSVVIARKGLVRGAAPILAYNSVDSQSGWAAAQGAARLNGADGFAGFVATGAHAGSLAAVAEGRADMACLDAVSWRLLHAFDPRADDVVTLGETEPTPGLPLICARGRDPEPLRIALARATASFAPAEPGRMGGPMRFTLLAAPSYHAIPVPPPPPDA